MKNVPCSSLRCRWPESAVDRFGRRESSARRGVVLIVVLVVVTMISLAGFGFLAGMSTEYEVARLNGSMRQAGQTLASAESALLWITSLPEQQRRIVGGLHHNPMLLRGQVVAALTDSGNPSPDMMTSLNPGFPAGGPVTGNTTGNVTASGGNTGDRIVDQAGSASGLRPDDRWRFSVVAVDAGEDQMSVLRFGLKNESSRLNLFRLLQWEQRSPGAGRAALLQLPGMTEVSADCILDWLDADDQTREFGAEAEYYQTLDRPYRPTNGLPVSLTELLYVKGVSRSLLLGTQNVGGESFEDGGRDEFSDLMMTPQNSDSGLNNSTVPMNDGWQRYLTVHSAERDSNDSGQPRIALNATDMSALERQLSDVLPTELVRYLLLARVYGLNPARVPGVVPSAAPFSTTMPAAYPVSSLAELIDSSITVSAAGGPLAVQSPLLSDDPGFAELFDVLVNHVSTQPESVVRGRIHLMTAPEIVIRMIPGISPELASQIATTRNMLDDAERNSLCWLLTRGVLSIELFRSVFPELTTGGDVFQAEIVAHRASGGPVLRRNVVINAATRPVRRVHWVDITDQPLEYSLDMLLPAF